MGTRVVQKSAVMWWPHPEEIESCRSAEELRELLDIQPNPEVRERVRREIMSKLREGRE